MENRRLETLKQIAHGVAVQFGDKCEVVIHDVTPGRPDHTIVYIENGHVSGRKVGDGASQVVLDSTRYDADFFRFNGFVHLTQVLAAAAVALSAAWLSVRAVKKSGLRPWHWGCWAALAGGMGLAGYMEYYVQRRADQAALGYGLMSGGMALAGAACVLLCVGRNRAARKGKRSIGPEEI